MAICNLHLIEQAFYENEKKYEEFNDQHGEDTPMERRGQPAEPGQSYVFLATRDSRYTTGEVIHVNGGDFTSS